MSDLTMPTMLDVETIAEHWYLLPAVMPVPEMGMLSVNSLLLSGSEPLLVDTGIAGLEDDYINQLKQIIDPARIKWVWLSHLDADHVGNLERLLELAPQAKILTSFLGFGKLMLQGVDVSRIEVIQPGDTLYINGREIKVIQPAYFDAPETIGFYDTKAKLMFCSDCFGATFNRPYSNIDHVPFAALEAGLSGWLDIDTPWLKNANWQWLLPRLDDIENMGAELLISSHLPGVVKDIHKLVECLKKVYWQHNPSSDQLTVSNNVNTVKAFFSGTHHPDPEQLDVIDKTVAERVITHGFPAGQEPYDRQSYKQFFLTFRQSFSDMTYVVNNIIADGQLVSCYFEINVKHSGEFAAIPATGREVSFSGIVMYRLDKGLIQETWLQIDMLSILHQIGGAS